MDWTNRNTLMWSRAKRRLQRLVKRLRAFSAKAPPKVPRRHQRWSIGIYTGDSPFHFFPHEHADNPVLTGDDVSDVPAAFVADPFILNVDRRWYMFFEVMNRRTRKGEIGLAVSEDGLKWAYRQIVLAEPFHLSYPYVFEWMNNYYMIPESHKVDSIFLYKAVAFPTQWSCLGILMNGHRFSDSSIFRSQDKWWLFTETDPGYKFDTLRLYHADDLAGPWHEHPQSPLIKGNMQIARPAGRVIKHNDRFLRYAQDCCTAYGTQVAALEITELTTAGYEERQVSKDPILTASGVGWNASGMHHIDPHRIEDGRWLACVDGFEWQELKR